VVEQVEHGDLVRGPLVRQREFGTYRRTGASSATFPSATRRITAVAVKVLVTEAIRNSVSGRTGSGFSTLVTP
jgi:hypothetical protein